MAQSATIDLSIISQLTGSLDLGNPRSDLSYKKQTVLSNGTGANQADLVWHDRRTLTASGTENIDVAGVLTDALGAAFTLAKLKAIIIVAATGNTNLVVVSRPATNGVVFFNAASDALSLAPGGVFMMTNPAAAGIPVTASTGDLITITNSAGGTDVTYDIILIGASA